MLGVELELELEDEGEMEEQEIRRPLSTAEEESEEGRERTTATMDALIERLLASGEQLASRVDVRLPLSSDEVHFLCRKAALLFASEPSLLEIEPPVSICGDVHGQFRDLLRIFRENGSPEGRQYLFLGDYVDRGSYSLETICLLLAYKCRWPKRFYLLRGNHECSDVNRYHGFYEECRRRMGQNNCYVWRWFNTLFNWMPLAAAVGQRIFCTHGGLSPELESVDQIRQLIRPIDEVPPEGLLTDLLWADPDPHIGESDEQWQTNEMRGISWIFGAGAVRRFCENNEIDVVVRAHQVVSQGYEIFSVGAELNLVTIFSAPNYGHQCFNYAAVMNVNVDLIVTFLQIDIFELRPDLTPPFDRDNDD